MRNLKELACRCGRIVEADNGAVAVKCWACTQMDCQKAAGRKKEEQGKHRRGNG